MRSSNHVEHVEHVNMEARLRQVDEHVTRQREQSSRLPEVTAPHGGAIIVPAPRRVPVYLRCHAGSPGFGELTITHPIVAPRGEVRPA